MSRIATYLKKPFIKHTVYWIVVFVFYITSGRERFQSTDELLVSFIFHVALQIIIAYSVLLVIVPRYHKNKNILEGVFLTLILLFGINILYTTGRMFILEPSFPHCYMDELKTIGQFNFLERIFYIKSSVLDMLFFYLQPLFFLIALQFYDKQLKLTEINEQKKIAELSALKNQLNPHFLFNTLNNLYALAIKKSDRTPMVIERLSNILDYMIYRCNDRYVSLQREIELIDNYIALEKVRYGDRVNVHFTKTLKKEVKIAPLLILTFVENAFKHGVSQALHNATIDIVIELEDNYICFCISNTKPKSIHTTESDNKNSVGLENTTKQLELLYKDAYFLKIDNSASNYTVSLKLKQR